MKKSTTLRYDSKVVAPVKKKTIKQEPYNEESALRKFFVDQIKDIYWAEKHLLKAIPKMEKAATTDELKAAFNTHLEATQGHVDRLEQVFELLELKPQAKKCEALEGITKEAETIIEETTAKTLTRDAALIIAAQKVEHYEITSYGSLVYVAKVLGEDEVAGILEETLREEKETDENLTKLSEEKITMQAFNESSSEEDSEDEE